MADVGSVLKSVGGNITRAAITLGGRSSVLNAGDTITFELPINPTELSMSAQAGEGNKQWTSNGATHRTMHPHIELRVVAYVDEVNTYDAFLYEKINGSVVKTAVNVVKNIAKEYNVSAYVDGLLAALKQDTYCTIWFNWGNMSYGGTLNSVNATYTMFSPLGHPIRARIEMVIVCVSTKETSLMVDWADKYENAIKKLAKTEDLSKASSANLGGNAVSSAVGRVISF